MLEERVKRPRVPLANTPPERVYVWGQRGPNDLVLRQRDTDGNGTLDETLYALHDANFNTIALSDPTGNIVERFVYDAYGRPFFYDGQKFQQESPHDWNLLFGGYSYDAEIGLYHVRRRIYHPLLGRWLQQDPQGYADSGNLYQYVAGSPLSYTDPMGEYIESGWDIFSLGVGLASLGHSIYTVATTGEGWGNLGMDVVGVLVDAGALALPCVPGGVSVAIRGGRAGFQASRRVQTGYRVLNVARRVDTGINMYQSGQAAVGAYQAYQEGDMWGLGMNLVGASFGGFHLGLRGYQFAQLRRLRNLDNLTADAVRLSQRSVRQALRTASRQEAGYLAERIFDRRARRLYGQLAESGSSYRLFTQQAARRTGRNVGRRVMAWDSFTGGRWRKNTKRLDWIISDVTTRPANRNMMLWDALVGSDFTVSPRGARGVLNEYADAFPNTQLIGIDPARIVGF